MFMYMWVDTYFTYFSWHSKVLGEIKVIILRGRGYSNLGSLKWFSPWSQHFYIDHALLFK